MRLIINAPSSQRYTIRRATFGTASWNKTTQSWSCPLDVTLLKSLLATYPYAQVSQGLLDYMAEQKTKQTTIAAVTVDNTEIFPDDTLMGFQRASVRFLEETKRGVLGHDTGTGKTVIAAAAIRYLGVRKTLIVCPDNVKWSWVDHIKEWAMVERTFVLESGSVSVGDSANVIMGSAKGREDGISKFIATEDDFVLILNYRQLSIHQKLLASIDYDVVIFDEAHRLGNRKTQQTTAARIVSARSVYVWMLTATPVRNKEIDLWPMLSIADPIRFTGFWNFVNTYCNTVPGIYGGTEILGMRDAESFNSMLAQYIFAKAKEEVLVDLPKKLPPVVHKLSLTPYQHKIYVDMERKYAASIQYQLDAGETLEQIVRASNTITQIMRLRQICLSPDILLEDTTGRTGPYDITRSAKLLALKELFGDLVASGEQFIVFSGFLKFLGFAGHILNSVGGTYRYITGNVSSSDRALAQKELTDGTINAILGTPRSMGEGMNLQAATVAIFCDLDWVPAVNIQAEGRVYRWGIKVPPTIMHLVHPNTVEADILATCQRKEGIIDNTVGQLEAIRSILRRGELL